MSPFWLGYLRMSKNKLGVLSIHWDALPTLSCVSVLFLSVFTCPFSIRQAHTWYPYLLADKTPIHIKFLKI